MTATDELRKLLDERGVEWYEPTMKPNTTWFPDAYGINCRVKPWGDALCVKRYGLTPEQAIAATLGERSNTEQNGVGSSRFEQVRAGTCKWEYPQGVNGWLGYTVCSECGERFDECVTDVAHYCPSCGRKVEE